VFEITSVSYISCLYTRQSAIVLQIVKIQLIAVYDVTQAGSNFVSTAEEQARLSQAS
jgi:hypothetical protein